MIMSRCDLERLMLIAHACMKDPEVHSNGSSSFQGQKMSSSSSALGTLHDVNPDFINHLTTN